MPIIRSSADLRNKYNEISMLCHDYNEPIFITKNGKGDLAVMSMEAFEEMEAKIELLSKLQEGIKEADSGLIRPYNGLVAELRGKYGPNTR